MFSLNSVTKIFVIRVKKFEHATSCLRNQDTTKVAVIPRFPESTEFLFHLGKAPMPYTLDACKVLT